MVIGKYNRRSYLSLALVVRWHIILPTHDLDIG